MDVRCRLCYQLISPDDTVEYDYGVLQVDCGRPPTLSPEEHVILYVFCLDHVVAACPACSKSFRQEQLGSDLFDSRTYGRLYRRTTSPNFARISLPVRCFHSICARE